MARTYRTLPPARSLVVFEAAARLLNFSAAGRHVGISQAAVSKQIQVLEAMLGVKLFKRSNRGLALTAGGRRLYQGVASGLDQIFDAMEEVRPRLRNGPISITTTIAAASVWLMPRIAKFRSEHPRVDLRVLATDSILDLADEGVDVAIRYGMGAWPGTTGRKLFGIELFPVCSPAYLQSADPIRSVSDIWHSTLLHVDEPNSRDAAWKVWLEAIGAAPAPDRGGLRFNNYPLLIQAAVNGQGLALGWGHLIDDYLANGSLVRCLATTLALKPAFYIVTADDAAPGANVQTFVDWIIAETAGMRDAAEG